MSNLVLETQGVLYVNQFSESNIEDGTLINPYKEVQSAVDKALERNDNGIVIKVFNGYYEPVNIEGNNNSLLIIEGSGGPDNLKGVTLDGLTIENSRNLQIKGLAIYNICTIGSGHGDIEFENVQFLKTVNFISTDCVLNKCKLKNVNILSNSNMIIKNSEANVDNDWIIDTDRINGYGFVQITNCKIFKLMHHSGTVVVDGGSTQYAYPFEGGNSIYSDATSTNGKLYLMDGTLFQNQNHGVWGNINIQGDVTFCLGMTIYNERYIYLAHPEKRIDVGINSSQLYDHTERPNLGLPTDHSLKGWLDLIDSKLAN